MPLSERSLIAQIRRSAGSSKALVRGIGDDCAVLQLPRGHQALVTTDFSLEGVHFRREWYSPESVGHRCATRGLSDIAAMGGRPLAVFVSVALPANTSQKWVDKFSSGLLAAIKAAGATLAGGDTAQSPSHILADVVVLGSLPAGTAVLRSGAKPGDRIFVTGTLGLPSTAVNLLLGGVRKKLNPKHYRKLFFPEARVAVGEWLREHRLATAMIDLSDGLSTDLSHICEESVVGAEIYASTLPPADIPGRPAHPDLHHVLHGGDEYELLFTVRPGRRVPRSIAGVPVTEIGSIVAGKRILLVAGDGSRRELRAQGWEHFRAS
ncbi:MAG: thiamine-phosphate kinase [Acidobacteriales bacterium]|nr:thiamine-phosphate kinase [Terriglobales bacterium]